MQNKIEYIIFLIFSGFVRALGLSLSRRLSYLLAVLFYYCIPIRKETVFENLKTAFPEYDEKKIKKIAFGTYRSFLITLMEILYLPSLDREGMKNFLFSEYSNVVTDAFSRNKGLILLSGHFGNWEYLAMSMALKVNIPFTVIVKDQRNGFVSKWLNAARTKYNNKIVLLGPSIRQIYKELKERNIVALVADQRGDASGLRVNFFNKATALNSGPALLSLKTGAPIAYGLAIRQPDYSYKVIVEEISVENLPENEADKVQEITQRHTAFLEKYIRQYPEQWLWMHKIWKY
jgi:KDO2-lipid IV(A) lauroyltransferase